MATDPRAALERLVAAFEAHLSAAQRRRGEADPGVEAAYRALADAFEDYDEALYAAHDEVTPFVLYDDVEDDRDDEADDLDDDDLDDDEEDAEDDAGLDDAQGADDLEIDLDAPGPRRPAARS